MYEEGVTRDFSAAIFSGSHCTGLLAVDDTVWFDGVIRGCGTAPMIECSTITNQAVPELHLTEATGELCYCTGELCNSAPQVSVSRTVLSFAVVSLPALAAARIFSQ